MVDWLLTSTVWEIKPTKLNCREEFAGTEMTNWPSISVVVPVVVPTTSTLTPGRVSPVSASVTTPFTCCCAQIGNTHRKNSIPDNRKRVVIFFIVAELTDNCKWLIARRLQTAGSFNILNFDRQGLFHTAALLRLNIRFRYQY